MNITPHYTPSVTIIKPNKTRLLSEDHPFVNELRRMFTSHTSAMRSGDLLPPISGPYKGINVIDEVLAFNWAFRDAMSKRYA